MATASAFAAQAPATARKVPAASGLLAPIFDAVRRRAGKAAHRDASAFAEAFYRRMTEEEIPLHTADGWAALAADLFEFAAKRKPGTANVRLFNPVLKTHGWESPHTVLQVVNDDMPFLVDSVTMALAEQGIGVHVLGHPVIALRRDRGCGTRRASAHNNEVEQLTHAPHSASATRKCTRRGNWATVSALHMGPSNLQGRYL